MERAVCLMIIGYLIVSVCATEYIICDEPIPHVESAQQHEEHSAQKPFFSFLTFHRPFPYLYFPKLPEYIHVGKPLKKNTITATKTVYIEITKTVTKHPICVTAYGRKPPCLNNNDELDVERELENDNDGINVEEQRFPIEPTKVVELSTVRSTSKLEGTEPTSAAEEYSSDLDIEQTYIRNARYLVQHPELKFEPETDEVPDRERKVDGILKHTHYITKSLYVTKVLKTTDHRVTATLVAKNCIPTNPRLPTCSPKYPVIGGGIHNHIKWKVTEENQEEFQESVSTNKSTVSPDV